MTELQKRIAAVEKALEDAGNTIARHGVNGLASLDNVKRLLGDVSIISTQTKQTAADLALYFYKDQKSAEITDAYPYFGDEPALTGYAIYNWLVMHPNGKVEISKIPGR